ncbi:MAG: LamG domain-containing protein [Candidatus Micrarchaeia archaeon]
MKDTKFKGFIFTLDAIFSLIVASAAVSILLYIHFVTPVESQSPVMQAQGLMSGMLSLKLSSALYSGIIPSIYSNPYGRNNATGTYAATLNGAYGTDYNYIQSSSFAWPYTGSNWGPATLSLWFKVGSLAGARQNQSLVTIWGPGYYVPILIYKGDIAGSFWGASTIVGAPLSTGKWYHVVLTGNSTSQALYLNGVLQGTSSGGSWPPQSSTVQIAAGYTGGHCISPSYCNINTTNFDGYEANLQLYSKQMPAAEVQTLYNEGIFGAPISISNLTLWYPLNGNPYDYNYVYSGYDNGVSYSNQAIMPFGTYNASLNSTLLQTIGELYLNNETAYAIMLLDRFTNDTNIALMIGNKYAQGLKAASFDGTNSYINTTAGFVYPHFTIAAWVKFNSLQNSMIETGYPINANHLLMLEDGNGNCNNIGAGSGYIIKVRYNGVTDCSTMQPLTGIWYFIVGTYNGRSLDLYVNGSLNSHYGSAGNASISYYETIGGCLDCGSSYYMNGLIADLQMYNTALTPAQIERLYLEGMEGMPINDAGLQAWYTLDGNTQDYSQNFNTGIAHNLNYAYTNYTPSTISGAYQISKASIPMSIKEGNNITLENVSLILWN